MAEDTTTTVFAWLGGILAIFVIIAICVAGGAYAYNAYYGAFPDIKAIFLGVFKGSWFLVAALILWVISIVYSGLLADSIINNDRSKKKEYIKALIIIYVFLVPFIGLTVNSFIGNSINDIHTYTMVMIPVILLLSILSLSSCIMTKMVSVTKPSGCGPTQPILSGGTPTPPPATVDSPPSCPT